MYKFVSSVFIFIFIFCQPSKFLQKRYADFNFTDEGFLTPHLLQTVGRVNYQSTLQNIRNDKRLCLELAQREARDRLLRIMLHIKLDLHDNYKVNQIEAQSKLAVDYPFIFQKSDLLQAELDFASLLNQAFIAIQDSRNSKECMVIYRIQEKQLVQKIRELSLTFYPKL